MIDILSRQGLAALDRLMTGRPLLAFDFDGTLAPLTPNREDAVMRRSTHALLRDAARRHPLAVISGRARADLIERLKGIPGVAAVGNHGAENGRPRFDRSLRRRVSAWGAALGSVLASTPGIEVEDKGLTLAVHYRGTRDPEAAQERIRSAAHAFPDARVTGGHSVVNVIPAELPTKGSALEKLAPGFGCDAVLFVGDDVTDEDAFESPCVDVGVRIGRDPASAARYYLEDQDRIDQLLRIVLAASPGRG